MSVSARKLLRVLTRFPVQLNIRPFKERERERSVDKLYACEVKSREIRCRVTRLTHDRRCAPSSLIIHRSRLLHIEAPSALARQSIDQRNRAPFWKLVNSRGTSDRERPSKDNGKTDAVAAAAGHVYRERERTRGEGELGNRPENFSVCPFNWNEVVGWKFAHRRKTDNLRRARKVRFANAALAEMRKTESCGKQKVERRET